MQSCSLWRRNSGQGRPALLLRAAAARRQGGVDVLANCCKRVQPEKVLLRAFATVWRRRRQHRRTRSSAMMLRLTPTPAGTAPGAPAAPPAGAAGGGRTKVAHTNGHRPSPVQAGGATGKGTARRQHLPSCQGTGHSRSIASSPHPAIVFCHTRGCFVNAGDVTRSSGREGPILRTGEANCLWSG